MLKEEQKKKKKVGVAKLFSWWNLLMTSRCNGPVTRKGYAKNGNNIIF